MLIHSIKFCFHTARKLCAPLCLISKLFKEVTGTIRLHCEATRCAGWSCRTFVLDKQSDLWRPSNASLLRNGPGVVQGRKTSATGPQLPKAPRTSCSHVNLGIRAFWRVIWEQEPSHNFCTVKVCFILGQGGFSWPQLPAIPYDCVVRRSKFSGKDKTTKNQVCVLLQLPYISHGAPKFLHK